MSTGQIITPAGRVVQLGSPVRAKTVAINPNRATHSAAVLLMGANNPIEIVDLITGNVLQSYTSSKGTDGSIDGLAYSADGKFLYFSQDYENNMSIANVDGNGMLTEYGNVYLPYNPHLHLYTPGVSNPAGIAATPDGKTAYVLINASNTGGRGGPHAIAAGTDKADPRRQFTQRHPAQRQLAVCQQRGRRVATAGDFTNYSDGTRMVADPHSGSADTGTVSQIDTRTNQVIATIDVGLRPVGMAISNGLLYVANAHSELISVVDALTNKLVRSIGVSLPVPGHPFGADPVGLAIVGNVAYVSLYTANCIAVVDLTSGNKHPVMGLIPTASTPTNIVFDAPRNQLVVANDKGLGTQGSLAYVGNAPGYETHHDTGTLEYIPLPDAAQLATLTRKVHIDNHWDLSQNIQVGPQFVNPGAAPKAIPVHIGEPSLIKHVFWIIKENRTYDQELSDDSRGNGDTALLQFGRVVTPNIHALVQRFPLLDNFYDPSRQSADGHPWELQAIAPHMDEIQSGDWVRSYPSQGNDSLAYSPKGWIWQAAATAGVSVKVFGEYVEFGKVEDQAAAFLDRVLPGGAEGRSRRHVASDQRHHPVLGNTVSGLRARSAFPLLRSRHSRPGPGWISGCLRSMPMRRPARCRACRFSGSCATTRPAIRRACRCPTPLLQTTIWPSAASSMRSATARIGAARPSLSRKTMRRPASIMWTAIAAPAW